MELIAAEEAKTQVKAGYKKTEVGTIPIDWEVKSIGDIVSIAVGRDLKEENFSAFRTDLHKYPVFSNTVSDEGLYGFYKEPEYNGESLTVVGRGVGLGTAFKRSGGFGAIGRLLVLFPEKNIDAGFLTEYINHRVKIFSESGGIPQLTGLSLKGYKVPVPPTLKEQQAIFCALADMNVLISNLNKLITKKKAIKQGAMQQLLKSPKQGGKRLPGFKGEWEETILGEIAEFHKGKGLPKSAITTNGRYKCIHYGELFTKYSEVIDTVLCRTNAYENTFLSSSNDVLMPTSDVTPNGLATASCIKEAGVIIGGDTLIIRVPESIIDGSFLSFIISQNKHQIMQLVTGTTVYHLYASDMKKFNFSFPHITEQKEIVKIISTMASDLGYLEKKKAKYQSIKQGMMQELLTGKTRLV